jgi:hypothetical protein
MKTPANKYATCPYNELPLASRWADAVAGVAADAINPHMAAPFRMDPRTRIASAGSCFAQHLSSHLVAKGMNYFVTEPAPPWLTAEEKRQYNYETYSARYGNIYTVLHLIQLVEEAFGRFQPAEPPWPSDDGHFIDPLRPRIQPNGFSSLQEMQTDRRIHLAAVRRLFAEMDVFLFTLGLTECWRSRRDGAVFPVCPGCGTGEFDQSRYVFQQFRVLEVIDHLNRFFQLLKEINPGARVILTVSPVPLVATMTNRHVLQATVYAKSVLRVAVEETLANWPNAAYFASYEIATATANSHHYFEPDRRTVAPVAVASIMKVFFDTFVEGLQDIPVQSPSDNLAPAALEPKEVCDELALFQALGNQRTQS